MLLWTAPYLYFENRETTEGTLLGSSLRSLEALPGAPQCSGAGCTPAAHGLGHNTARGRSLHLSAEKTLGTCFTTMLPGQTQSSQLWARGPESYGFKCNPMVSMCSQVWNHSQGDLAMLFRYWLQQDFPNLCSRTCFGQNL